MPKMLDILSFSVFDFYVIILNFSDKDWSTESKWQYVRKGSTMFELSKECRVLQNAIMSGFITQRTWDNVNLNKTKAFQIYRDLNGANDNYILHLKYGIVSEVIVSWVKFTIPIISWGRCIVTPLLNIIRDHG